MTRVMQPNCAMVARMPIVIPYRPMKQHKRRRDLEGGKTDEYPFVFLYRRPHKQTAAIDVLPHALREGLALAACPSLLLGQEPYAMWYLSPFASLYELLQFGLDQRMA